MMISVSRWFVTPYVTRLEYDRLEGLQEKEIHDFYPVSFRFQFDARNYSLNNALTGLKVYDERNMLLPDTI